MSDTVPSWNNKYTQMQKAYYDYEGSSGSMNVLNHSHHNVNPDYWTILVKDTLDNKFRDKVGLDFGCGCGRNVFNLYRRFKHMSGVDISPALIETCYANLKLQNYPEDRMSFFVCDGVSLSCFENNRFDFVMSTIVLQHICVYDIRFNYLKEFYRVLKEGGLLSIQMGFGEGHPNTRDYYDNYYDAEGTNSVCDVKVDNPEYLVKDLTEIGFKEITYEIRPSFEDTHEQWIYAKCHK
jgi:ubiquinone/menaquinone biosynthesis C-methylase UbiE